MSGDFDALVIGAGPNGLVAANLLADAGWSVLVLEEQVFPGGAVRSGELTEQGFTSDLFSSFYPLAAGSPVLRSLDLEQFGLRWRRAPVAVAHPQPDGRCASIALDPAETKASLESFAPRDGDAWEQFQAGWQRAGGPFLEALLRPFPPVRGAARLTTRLGPAGLVRFARLGIVSVRQLAQEWFDGEGAAWLLAGNALHADLTPDSAGSGLFGWAMCGLAQEHGFPVPEGGAGRLTESLTARLRARGGRVECGTEVTRILVSRRSAVAVRTADGREIAARRAILASTGAPSLYLDLIGEQHLPASLIEDLRAFEYDNATIKVDWSLDAPIPWVASEARRAGTIHVADGVDALARTSAQLANGVIPDQPFLVMGQYSMTDPSRQPPGKETAWAYTHVPQDAVADAGDELSGSWSESELDAFVERIEHEVERRAPGFRDLIRNRHVFSPAKMQRANRNLVGGAINSGTAQLHQQVVFRPTPGLGRAETPLRRLYLAGASAHPGGGVHGAPGANAARAAIWHHRINVARKRLTLS